jgi:anti-sigma B factor antagonist
LIFEIVACGGNRPLDISVRKQSTSQVVKLRGTLRLGVGADSLKSLLDELIGANDTHVVLNLAEVPMMDSSGIGVLVRGLTSMKERGGSIKLVQPSKMVLQTLKLVAVLGLFEIFENEEDAVKSFG